PMVDGICAPLIREFGLDGSVGTTIEDTLVVLHMIVRQIPHRYPDIKIIVPHFGGLIPMLLNRMDNQVAATTPNLPEKPSATARMQRYGAPARPSAPSTSLAAAPILCYWRMRATRRPFPTSKRQVWRTSQSTRSCTAAHAHCSNCKPNS